MLVPTYQERCRTCSGKVLDLNEELVCSSCGTVVRKEILEVKDTRLPQALDYLQNSLGSFLGPPVPGYEEDSVSGFTMARPAVRYLKALSDFSQRDDPGVYRCFRLIERACEKLSLPFGVTRQSITIARSLLEIRGERTGYTLAAISAFSVISACKLFGVTSVGVREVLATHKALGCKVRSATIMRMSFDSPVRVGARSAEEYLARMTAHVSDIIPRTPAPAGYQNRMLEIAKVALRTIEPASRGGRNPCALAATSFYAAEVILARHECRQPYFSQRDLAECVNIAEYTVREQFCQIFRAHMEAIFREVRPVLSRIPPQSSRTSPLLLGLLARPV